MEKSDRPLANFTELPRDGLYMNKKIDFESLPLCVEEGDNREYKIATGTISTELIKGGG